MRAHAGATSAPTLILRRHPVALVPRLLVQAGIVGILASVSTLRHSPWLALAGVLLFTVGVICQIAAWQMFTITVRFDRVKVRRFRWGLVQQTTYALPGLRGLTCEQGYLDRLWDSGTVTMALPDRTLRFTKLTPYSALDTMLGWS